MESLLPTKEVLYLNTRMNHQYHHLMSKRSHQTERRVKVAMAFLSGIGSIQLFTSASKWFGLPAALATVVGSVSAASALSKDSETHSLLAEEYSKVLTEIRLSREDSEEERRRLFALFDAAEKEESKKEKGQNAKILALAQKQIRAEEVVLLARMEREARGSE